MKLNPITDNIMNRIHQKMSLEQKIQTLKEDFLDRDQTTFVKIRRTGRLGWESSIPEGTPYFDIEKGEWRCFRVDKFVKIDKDYVL